uniref:transposase family protein n=1 Tax=Segatella sp. TaxID=2974253 RepID=UPI003AAA61ED
MIIIKLYKQIADPLVAGLTVHKMEHIIYITIAEVISGDQSWNEIAEFVKSKLEFFKKRLQGLDTIPSHDTFNRFF